MGFAYGGNQCYAPARPLPSHILDQHLSLSEARSFTGKSETTLKRLIREITSEPGHPDRSCLLPSSDEIERRRAAKEPYAWKIERQLLQRRFPPEAPKGGDSGGVGARDPLSAPPELMLQILREQLSSKDQQIRTLETQLNRKDEQIGSLNERMRESNVLMRELQQRLAIAPPKGIDTVVEPITPKPPASEPAAASKPTPQKPKPVSTPAAPPLKKKSGLPRRSFFGRMFRSAQP